VNELQCPKCESNQVSMRGWVCLHCGYTGTQDDFDPDKLPAVMEEWRAQFTEPEWQVYTDGEGRTWARLRDFDATAEVAPPYDPREDVETEDHERELAVFKAWLDQQMGKG
jgi:hypothetical protein